MIFADAVLNAWPLYVKLIFIFGVIVPIVFGGLLIVFRDR